MPAHRHPEMTEAVRHTLETNGGNLSDAARQLGVARQTIQHHVRLLGGLKALSAGRVKSPSAGTRPVPSRGTRRYILTCAQNNTPVNRVVWENLLALSKYHKAELLCASFTYNQNAYGKLAVKAGTYKGRTSELWYDEAVRPYLEPSDRNIELAPGLMWCGRMNTLPTAAQPLSGFETYTGRASGILPHAKLAMQSVAMMKDEGAKFNYTTGTVTQLNYIQKRAGIKAEFHHTYGALIVEVDAQGRWFVRQLNADKRGRIYDLDLLVEDGKVTRGNSVEAINWGDAHVIQMDPRVRALGWGKGGMLDTLRPRHQFMHDLVDFRARNHHEIGNPHLIFRRYVEGEDSVQWEMEEAAKFLHEAEREWCKTVVVDSNHDNALTRWLRDADFRRDPVNAEFYLRCQLRKYESIRKRERGFHMIEYVLRDMLSCPKTVRFLREDESYIICGRTNEGGAGGIECGMHGHLGPDGRRGTPQNLSRMGRRANTGHTHSAGIIDGLYTAGTCSLMDVGYNKGPSSWSHTMIVTYPNGKRALVTCTAGAWRAA